MDDDDKIHRDLNEIPLKISNSFFGSKTTRSIFHLNTLKEKKTAGKWKNHKKNERINYVEYIHTNSCCQSHTYV